MKFQIVAVTALLVLAIGVAHGSIYSGLGWGGWGGWGHGSIYSGLGYPYHGLSHYGLAHNHYPYHWNNLGYIPNGVHGISYANHITNPLLGAIHAPLALPALPALPAPVEIAKPVEIIKPAPAPVIVANAEPAKYYAANPGAIHEAPLPGHTVSQKILNLAPPAGTA